MVRDSLRKPLRSIRETQRSMDSITAAGIAERTATSGVSEELISSGSVVQIPVLRTARSLDALAAWAMMIWFSVDGQLGAAVVGYIISVVSDMGILDSLGMGAEQRQSRGGAAIDVLTEICETYNVLLDPEGADTIRLLINQPTGCFLSVTACYLLLIVSKAQIGRTTQTYLSRRIRAFVDAMGAALLEGPFIRERVISDEMLGQIVTVARSSSALARVLFGIVRELASSNRQAVAKPAQITLSLVAFAQATPFVLAVRYALDVEAIARLPGLAGEVRRVAAGIEAVKATDYGVEYARLADVRGATLLAGKCVPTLAAIGQFIAVQQEGERWGQVALPRNAAPNVVEMGKRLYLQHVQLWDSLPSSFRNYGLISESPWEQLLWEAMQGVPAAIIDFFLHPSGTTWHVFTDGSCSSPTDSCEALASWAVVWAEHGVISSGNLVGVQQTILRSEATAVLSALHWAVGHSEACISGVTIKQ